MKNPHTKAVLRQQKGTFLICKGLFQRYTLLTIFEGETWSEETDSVDGSIITVIKSDGQTVNMAGEPCGVFETIGEARIHMHRLEKISEVMES